MSREYRFGDQLWFPQFESDVALFLARIIGIALPAITLFKTQQIGIAVLFGCIAGADGLIRAHYFRTTWYLCATDGGLITRGSSKDQTVPWVDVVSIKTWRRLNLTSHVALVIRSGSRSRYLRCWDYSSSQELAAFSSACVQLGGIPVGRLPSATSLFSDAINVRSLILNAGTSGLLCVATYGLRGLFASCAYSASSAVIEGWRVRTLVAAKS